VRRSLGKKKEQQQQQQQQQPQIKIVVACCVWNRLGEVWKRRKKKEK
jgi:hypothetical protein